MTAQATAATIRAGLVRAHTKLSADGTPLVATVTRRVGADETVYPPTPGTNETYTCVCGLGDVTEEDMRGAEVSAESVRVIISRPLVDSNGNETDPRNGDRVTVAGDNYNLVRVRATNFSGYALMWSCVCERSG